MRLGIEDEVEVVCEAPEVGELRVGDLAGIRGHKFRFNRQEYPTAYRPPTKNGPVEFLIIDFYQVGTHGNLCDELKQFLRHEKQTGETR